MHYRGTNWRYKHNRLHEDSFRYALAPAKYWKSFGTLDITIDTSKVKDQIAINLGTPENGDINGIANYHFNKLSVDIIQITRIPKLSSFAIFLLRIEFFWLAVILISFIVLFHVWKIYRFRKKNPQKKVSIVAVLGIIVIPILFMLTIIMASFWIDASTGEPYASGRESYGVFYSFLYMPKYIFIYVIFSIITDFLFKKLHAKVI